MAHMPRTVADGPGDYSWGSAMVLGALPRPPFPVEGTALHHCALELQCAPERGSTPVRSGRPLARHTRAPGRVPAPCLAAVPGGPFTTGPVRPKAIASALALPLPSPARVPLPRRVPVAPSRRGLAVPGAQLLRPARKASLRSRPRSPSGCVPAASARAAMQALPAIARAMRPRSHGGPSGRTGAGTAPRAWALARARSSGGRARAPPPGAGPSRTGAWTGGRGSRPAL